MSQKGLIGSLWALSVGPGCGDKLSSVGNPEGSDCLWGEMGLGNSPPRPDPPDGCPRRVPPGCAGGGGGAEPAALPSAGDAELPRLPQPPRVRVGGKEEKRSRRI